MSSCKARHLQYYKNEEKFLSVTDIYLIDNYFARRNVLEDPVGCDHGKRYKPFDYSHLRERIVKK